MSTPVWSFTENPFDNGTKGSRKKMNIISSDHNSKLHALISNALILALYNFFNPIRAAFFQKYVQWMSMKAAYKSATSLFEGLLAQLSGDKIEDFDIRIQIVYRRGTTQYEALLPDFREPFQQGGYDERIAALSALSQSMTGDVALAAIKTDVDAFLTLLVNARDAQQGKELLLGTISAELELERLAIAQAMYYTLGGLMQIFNTNSSEIAEFFDLETLRGALPDDDGFIVDGPVNPGGQVVNILNSSVTQYVPDVTLRIKNTSTIPAVGQLLFYAANNAGDGWGGIGHQLNPGDEVTFVLLAPDFKPFFNVQNQSPTPQTFEVEIL